MCRKSRRPTRSWKGQIYAKIADLEKRQAVSAQMWVYYSKTGNNSNKSKPHQMFQHFKVQPFQMFLAGFHIYSLSLLYSLHRPIFLFFQHQKFIIRIDAIVVLAFILIVSPSSGLISACPAQILLNGRRSIIQVDTSVQCSVLRGS